MRYRGTKLVTSFSSPMATDVLLFSGTNQLNIQGFPFHYVCAWFDGNCFFLSFVIQFASRKYIFSVYLFLKLIIYSCVVSVGQSLSNSIPSTLIQLTASVLNLINRGSKNCNNYNAHTQRNLTTNCTVLI